MKNKKVCAADCVIGVLDVAWRSGFELQAREHNARAVPIQGSHLSTLFKQLYCMQADLFLRSDHYEVDF